MKILFFLIFLLFIYLLQKDFRYGFEQKVILKWREWRDIFLSKI